MSPKFDSDGEPLADLGDAELTEFDTEPTIIIDDDCMDQDSPEEAYTVRRKAPASDAYDTVEPEVEDVLVVLPDSELPEVESADKPRFESPMQAVLESSRAEDVGLLSAHPDEPEGVAPSDASFDAGVPGQGVSPEVASYANEGLPELEDVEDITSMIEDEEVELDAPSEPFFASTMAPERSYGKWISIAALVLVMALGGIYGPQLYQMYLGGDSTPDALAQRPAADRTPTPKGAVVPAGPVDTEPDVDPVGVTPVGVTPVETAPSTDTLPAVPDFQEWLDSAVTANLTQKSTSAER